MRTAVFSDTKPEFGRVRFYFTNQLRTTNQVDRQYGRRTGSARALLVKPTGNIVHMPSIAYLPEQAEAIVTDGHGDCVAGRRFSTTRAGLGMLPPRLAPMPSTRRGICAPARRIGRARRRPAIERRRSAAKFRTDAG
jgi:hypothetical protein